MTYDIYGINFINSTYEKNIAKIYEKSEKYVIRHTFVIKNLKRGEIKMKIEIIELKKLNGDSNLKAICDFRLGDSEFYSWRVIQQPDQQAWVSSPQECWADDAGKKHYKPYIKLSKELSKIVSDAIIKAYNKVKNGG